ncbi:MAG TPA: 2,3-bisphosphoglycerate-independent phosphoglycerate mutase, partial [Chitinophagaceae bacterium]|nr:2,3-bisphosphoglycerate-independent phosphoglycerate mutase [Chitinophagaceae bacterium]
SDAIQQAEVPFTRSLYSKYPHAELITCGEAVGLPEGQMGNSEVGHLNIGAGRIVYQELQRITLALQSGAFESNEEFQALCSYVKKNNKTLHLMGLVSDGGVHSHIDHLLNMLLILDQAGVHRIKIHAFTDGRDTDPKSGHAFIARLLEALGEHKHQLATICGRYYAMDRDKRWERVKIAYDALSQGKGIHSSDVLKSIEAQYSEGITDEFLNPIIATHEAGTPFEGIQEGDAVFCFNFRTDRCREITEVLTQHDVAEPPMKTMPLYYVTMTEYDKNFKNVRVMFRNEDLKNTLGEVLEQNGKKQIRIAETEKYPHVTFFFSGGREKEFEGEKRILCASPRDVATYDLKPEMSAWDLTQAILPELEKQEADFICLNYANADMVGHTGVWNAVIKAVETVDACVKQVVEKALENGYVVFLTADHGNSDYMINEDGTPNTAHTLNPVPFFIISDSFQGKVNNGKLGDIAPTILHVMQLPQPSEMTGNCLV